MTLKEALEIVRDTVDANNAVGLSIEKRWYSPKQRQELTMSVSIMVDEIGRNKTEERFKQLIISKCRGLDIDIERAKEL